MKATLSKDSQLYWAKDIKTKLDNGGGLLVSITHTSRSNLSYRYKVWLAHNTDKGVELDNLGYWLASAYGLTLTDNHDIKGNGLGFCRYFQAVRYVAGALQDLGLADPRYEYDIRYKQMY
jgi:hypothetical protein